MHVCENCYGKVLAQLVSVQSSINLLPNIGKWLMKSTCFSSSNENKMDENKIVLLIFLNLMNVYELK